MGSIIHRNYALIQLFVVTRIILIPQESWLYSHIFGCINLSRDLVFIQKGSYTDIKSKGKFKKFKNSFFYVFLCYKYRIIQDVCIHLKKLPNC